MVLAVLLLGCLFASPTVAQEVSLIDLLQAKGILSEQESQQLRRGTAGGQTYDQHALLELLRAKGILQENDLAQLNKRQTAPAEVPPPSVASAPDLSERVAHLEQEAQNRPPLTAGYDNGFFLRSADGNFSLRIGGRASLHTFYQQEDTSQNDSFFIDRARAYMDGILYKYFQYKVEAELASSSILRDAYLNLNYDRRANVQIGQYKVPFSYEALLSKRYIDLVERSAVVLSTVSPSRDIGLMLHGRLSDGLFGYQLAVLNGSGQNRQDNNSAKDLAVRFVLAPFIHNKDSLFAGANLGARSLSAMNRKARASLGLLPQGLSSLNQ